MKEIESGELALHVVRLLKRALCTYSRTAESRINYVIYFSSLWTFKILETAAEFQLDPHYVFKVAKDGIFSVVDKNSKKIVCLLK